MNIEKLKDRIALVGVVLIYAFWAACLFIIPYLIHEIVYQQVEIEKIKIERTKLEIDQLLRERERRENEKRSREDPS